MLKTKDPQSNSNEESHVTETGDQTLKLTKRNV